MTGCSFDDRYAGSTRAARQQSGEGREAGEAVAAALLQEPLCPLRRFAASRPNESSVASVASVTRSLGI